MPEELLAADPVAYLRHAVGGWGNGLDAHPQEALAAYEQAFSDPRAPHAMFEDY